MMYMYATNLMVIRDLAMILLAFAAFFDLTNYIIFIVITYLFMMILY